MMWIATECRLRHGRLRCSCDRAWRGRRSDSPRVLAHPTLIVDQRTPAVVTPPGRWIRHPTVRAVAVIHREASPHSSHLFCWGRGKARRDGPCSLRSIHALAANKCEKCGLALECPSPRTAGPNAVCAWVPPHRAQGGPLRGVVNRRTAPSSRPARRARDAVRPSRGRFARAAACRRRRPRRIACAPSISCSGESPTNSTSCAGSPERASANSKNARSGLHDWARSELVQWSK